MRLIQRSRDHSLRVWYGLLRQYKMSFSIVGPVLFLVGTVGLFSAQGSTEIIKQIVIAFVGVALSFVGFKMRSSRENT